MCKTGCKQQVTYENIEFSDGFVYFLARNLDSSIHYCPIFYNHSFGFNDPGGPRFFDSNKIRENSYGHEIHKVYDFLYDFDIFLRRKKNSLQLNDILEFKNKLQSYLNNLPISGYFTDELDGVLGYWDEEYILKKGLNEPPGDKFSTFSFTPMHTLSQVYYVLGKTSDVLKCKKLIKDIESGTPDYFESEYGFDNPYEIKLIDVRKQLEILRDKLNEDPSNNEIKDAIQFYEYSISGWNHCPENSKGEHVQVPSIGLKEEILNWYEGKKKFLIDLKEAKEKNLSISELYDEKLDWPSEESFSQKGIEPSFVKNGTAWPKLETLRKHISSHDDELDNVVKNLKESQTELDEELIELEELESFDSAVKSKSNIPSFEDNFNQNSLFHLSITEQNLRRFIIFELFDNDVYFMKKHFNQIWDEIELTKIKQRRKISPPLEETELDFSNMGHLIKILENKETKNRAKSKNIESLSDLITKLDIVNEYRNQLAHHRGLIDGDLPIEKKMILVGLCNEINMFCANISYR
tara:strand:- start:86 stop:1651 length:1566 start_codon:yes stop_codon:yes gene_type:complete